MEFEYLTKNVFMIKNFLFKFRFKKGITLQLFKNVFISIEMRIFTKNQVI